MYKEHCSKSESGVCEFISKLSEMIRKEPHIISFSEDGQEVIIYDEKKFTNQLLPVYFRHDKWKSFVRQMNMYNFKKINRGINTFIFMNPEFTKDCPQNYSRIRRKIKSTDSVEDEHQSLRKDVLFKIDSSFGEISIGQFLSSIFDIEREVQDCFNQVKKSVDVVAKTKKGNEIKHAVNGVKETLQVIEETHAKFDDALHKYLEECQELSLKSKSMNFASSNSLMLDGEEKPKTTNLIIPQAIHPGSDQILRDFEPVPKPFPTVPNGLAVLGSFGSFTKLFAQGDD